ncbi:MAG: hypothetical protein E7017_04450 [Alphaproteobacteria bacterium]|nr:hypothetical protein [Alphaproteobacteria bacterium]
MAKQPSARDIIAKNVSTMIDKRLSKKSSTSEKLEIVEKFKESQKTDYSGYTSQAAKSITSVYRASQPNSQYRASKDDIDIYHIIASKVAEKRGITPKGTNGQFSEEQYAKELSPINLLKDLTRDSLERAYSSSASKEENEESFAFSRSIIEGGIESSYDNASTDEQATTLLNSVKQMTYMTDEEFAEIEDADTRNAYLQTLSDAEKDRLTKIYEEKSNKTFDPTNNASRFEGFDDDPDWGYKKDDDNFKIEQGDIIDYLMKEVILSSAAWAGNKVAGLGGIILYEGLTYTERKLSPYCREKKLGLLRRWDKFKENIFGDSNDPETQNRSALLDEFLGENGSLINAQTKALADYNAYIDDKKASDFSRYTTKKRTDMALGLCTPTKDGFTYPENKKYKYPGEQSEENKEKQYKFFDKLQKDIDKALLSEMKQEINPNNDSAKNTEIETWFKQRRDAEKDKLEGKTPRYPSANEDMEKAYKKAQNNTITEINALAACNEISAMKKHFEVTYTAYKVAELFRTDPKNELFKDDQDKTAKQKLSEAIDAFTLEGRAIFLHNLQNLRSGDTNAVSSAELIEKADKAWEKEQASKGAEKHSNPFQDTVEETKEESKRTELRNAFDNLTAEEVLSTRHKDLEKEKIYWNDQYRNNEDKRDFLEKVKQRCSETNEALTKAKEASNAGYKPTVKDLKEQREQR